jgi:hypothetical protein
VQVSCQRRDLEQSFPVSAHGSPLSEKTPRQITGEKKIAS